MANGGVQRRISGSCLYTPRLVLGRRAVTNGRVDAWSLVMTLIMCGETDLTEQDSRSSGDHKRCSPRGRRSRLHRRVFGVGDRSGLYESTP